MKEEILSIASDLREGSMTTNEAKEHLLRLFGVVGRSEQLKCDHEWKVEAFDCYGTPYEQYCEHCGKKEAI